MPADDDSKQYALTLGGWGLGVLACTLGWTLIVQGDHRLTAPAWHVALRLPVGTDFWGGYLIAAGVGMLLAMSIGRRARRLLLAGALFVSFALFGRATAGIITMDDPTASWLGPQLYGAFALIYMAHAAAHVDWNRILTRTVRSRR